MRASPTANPSLVVARAVGDRLPPVPQGDPGARSTSARGRGTIGTDAPEQSPCMKCGDPVGPSFGTKPRMYCVPCNAAGHGSRVWEPRERRAAFGTDAQGRAAVTCWCEARIMYVPFDDVREGRTQTCGREACVP